MKRQALTDGNGKWFDLDKAEKFSEDTYWNGSDHISLTTGSQWHHEALYRTAGGAWILNSWSQMSSSVEGWSEIDNEAAAAWLVVANEEPHPACSDEYAALELR